MVNKVNTLTTEGTFSWIVTKPISYYNPTRYFLIEFLTQITVGVLISFILLFTANMPFLKRIQFILIIGIIANIATYGRLTNWWGMSLQYSIGESLNLIIGWIIGAFISSKFIIKENLSYGGTQSE